MLHYIYRTTGIILSLMSVLLLNAYGDVQTTGTGMEMSDYRKLGLLIEINGAKEYNLELDIDRIRIKSKMRFQQNGITIVDKDSAEAYLNIVIDIDELTYSIKMHFRRKMFFSVGSAKTLKIDGISWTESITGIHHQSSGLIVLMADDVLQIFFDEYLRVNQK